MNRLLSFVLLLLIVQACGPAGSGTETSEATATTESSPAMTGDNTLSQAEKDEGWQLLFDGQSMDQWRLYNHDMLSGWSVADGEMVAMGEGGPDGHGADIVTKANYENFDLSLEWKISTGGNSGIFFNVIEGPEYEAVYHTGPEYQLIDDIGFPDELDATQHSGANYAMEAPSKITSKPAGEYNLSRIRVENGHVTQWLNGEKVIEYDMWTPAWEAQVQAGKWKDYPAYGKAKSGHIALQDHGNKIWFKNIKIKTL